MLRRSNTATASLHANLGSAAREKSTLALPTIVLRLSLAPWRATRPPVPASHARVAGDASTGRFYPLLPWRPAVALYGLQGNKPGK